MASNVSSNDPDQPPRGSPMIPPSTEDKSDPSKNDVLKPWFDRWESNRIRFHREEVNESLLRYLPRILDQLSESGEDPSKRNPTPQSHNVRVLVPLSGKTVDLPYLAQHDAVSEVVGVEGIQKAIDELSLEHPYLELNVTDENCRDPCGTTNELVRYRGKNITMIRGDFFKFDLDAAGGKKYDLIWDRASIVAIDPSRRGEYVDVISRVIKPGGVILLQTIDRRTGTDDARAMGPPYSFSESQVRDTFEGLPWVESVTFLEEHDEMAKLPEDTERFRKLGLTSLFEVQLMIQAKASSTDC